MEENESILMLTDENGNDHRFVFLDCIEYQGAEFLLLVDEEEVETENFEILVLRVEPADDPDMENYVAATEEEIDAVFDIFREKYKDTLNFEE